MQEGPPLPSRQEVGTWKTGPFGISAAYWACSQISHCLLPVHKTTIDNEVKAKNEPHSAIVLQMSLHFCISEGCIMSLVYSSVWGLGGG